MLKRLSTGSFQRSRAPNFIATSHAIRPFVHVIPLTNYSNSICCTQSEAELKRGLRNVREAFEMLFLLLSRLTALCSQFRKDSVTYRILILPQS